MILLKLIAILASSLAAYNGTNRLSEWKVTQEMTEYRTEGLQGTRLNCHLNKATRTDGTQYSPYLFKLSVAIPPNWQNLGGNKYLH